MDASLLLFRYGEKIELLKQEMEKSWPEIPVGMMDFFGAEALAAGAMLWAQKDNIDLAAILELKVSNSSGEKISDVLGRISKSLGMVGTQVNQLQTTFLEMLKWHMVEQLNTGLFANQRAEVAKILAGQTAAENNNRAVLQQIADYLGKSQLNTQGSKSYFEQALKISFAEMQRSLA